MQASPRPLTEPCKLQRPCMDAQCRFHRFLRMQRPGWRQAGYITLTEILLALLLLMLGALYLMPPPG